MEVSKITNTAKYSAIRGKVSDLLTELARQEDTSYTYTRTETVDLGSRKLVSIGKLEFFTSFHHLDDEVRIITVPRTVKLGDKGYSIGYDVVLEYNWVDYSSVKELIKEMKENPRKFFSVSLDEAYDQAGATGKAAKEAVTERFLKKIKLDEIELGFDKEVEEITDDTEDAILEAVRSHRGN